MAPVARAIAVALATGGIFGTAHAQQAFSSAWFAARGAAQSSAAATGRLPNGMPASALSDPSAQQQQANAQLQRSIANLSTAAQAIAAMQATQAAARQAAQTSDTSVPDGLSVGGLQVDTNSLTKGWINATAPTQTVSNAQTNVNIQQTADKAILNWSTFNVGKNTTVNFAQQANWAVLNRVNDPNARPSQIQGQIKGDGTVLIVNRNGVVFTGTSQTDTRNLVAAATSISDSQFTNFGLYGPNGTTPTFTDALGKVEVRAGAQLATRAPTSVTQGGGYVLLIGAEVSNAGAITTPSGQTQMAAGDSFVIRQGVGTTSNTYSTTRGNEISPQFAAGSTSGKVTNTGLIFSPEGDITLAGRTVTQNGVAVSSTTVNTRGTIHLLNAANDTLGSVTLGPNATTAIVINDTGATALDSQRAALIADSKVQNGLRNNAGLFNNLSLLPDREDQSRIEIVSGQDVQFQGGSLTLATGGQIAVSATRRSFVGNGATLDVSGAVGVNLSMASNNVAINVQGNEQRDSPDNRDSGNLINANVWIDRRRLIYVPAGVGGYANERWYTSGGLLEVGGYLSNQGHTVGEWAAEGGTVTLGGSEVVTQTGSSVNLSGGTLNVATGYLNQTWLIGSDGQLYNINNAPEGMIFAGVYKGFASAHARWGANATEYYYTPLIGPQSVLQNGYTVGRDAGQLVINAPTAVLEGDVNATVYNGPIQSQARSSSLDGYGQSQFAVAQSGGLVVGQYTGLGRTGVYSSDIRIDSIADITSAMSAADALDASRINTIWLDAARLNTAKLGSVDLATGAQIAIDQPLTLDNGGRLALTAPVVDINANLTARSGQVSVSNFYIAAGSTTNAPFTTSNGTSQLTLGPGATIDVRGLWTNLQTDPAMTPGLAYVNGGNVSFDSSQNVTLSRGSAIDVSSGGAILATGGTLGGTGGNVSLTAGHPFGNLSAIGALALDGAIRAVGVKGGGTLTISTPGNLVIGEDASLASGVLAAGAKSDVPVTLAQPFTIAAGQPLPLQQTLSFTSLAPGAVALVDITPVLPPNLVTQAAWVVPRGFAGLWAGNNLYMEGQTVPAGTLITSFLSGTRIAAGSALPTNVFPNGIPVKPYQVTYFAGSIQSVPITYGVGTLIAAGTVLPVTVQVNAAPALHSDFFNAGFANYDLNAGTGILVAGGNAINVAMPVYQIADASRAVPSGSDPSSAMQAWLPPTYLENPQTATLTQRGGASLTLRSTTLNSTVAGGGAIVVADNASITVDPGQNIKLDAFGQITVNGALTAHGGNVSLVSEADGTTVAASNFDAFGAGRANSIWVGEHGKIDVSGAAYVAYDASGRAYGTVTDGGSIYLGGNQLLNAASKLNNSTTAFIVIRPGAELNADGAQIGIDTAAGTGAGKSNGNLTLASNGGSMALNSYTGIFNDGNLHAAAGGAGASGGSLAIELDMPVYPLAVGTVPAAFLNRGVLSVTQAALGSGLPTNLAPGTMASAFTVGRANVSADAVKAGGFDTLSLTAANTLLFTGDVSLSLGRSLTVSAASIAQGALSSTGPASGTVSLAAPYVLLKSPQSPVTDNATVPGVAPTIRTTAAASTFNVDASLLDIQNTVAFSNAYKAERFTSAGDIRLLGVETNAGSATYLQAQGDLTLNAAQIYPVTGAVAYINAGNLTIGRTTDDIPALPMSVFGSLTLQANKIAQGGIVRAPLGLLVLGDNGGGMQSPSSTTTTLDLLPGSITSVSANGLTMPYGGTVDGVTYNYAGTSVTGRTFNTDIFGRLGTGIVLDGQAINVHDGATLDLSGGGNITGAAFVSGRGGSVDVLTTPQVNANPAAPVSRASDKVYAIVPGYASGYAPVGAEKGAGDPAIGQQITIPAGVPGLPAGTYTLLPSNYALLPGAYRVEVARNTAVSNGASFIGNGTYLTTGVMSVANTGIKSPTMSQLLVTPGTAVRSQSKYNEESYSQFLVANAALFGATVPLLPADAKSLELIFHTPSPGTTVKSLTFNGTALMQGASGGAAGEVFVAGGNNIEVYADAPTTGFNGISLNATDLNAVQASRLVIGGFDYLVPLGSVITFQAVDNATYIRNNVQIAADEIFLLGGAGGVTVGSGAKLTTLGRGPARFDTSNGYAYGSNGAAVLALSNGDLAFTSSGGTGSITVGPNATLYSEGTLAFATSGQSVIDPSAHFGSRNIALAVNTINIGSSGDIAAAGAPNGLSFDQTLFDQLVQNHPEVGVPALERLTLSAFNSVNVFGSASLDAGNSGVNLVFITPSIYGYGAAGDQATIAASKITWNGVIGATPPNVVANGPGTGLGTLTLKANEIDLGKYLPLDLSTTTRTLYGFGNVNLVAGTQIVSAGNSSLSVYQSPSTTAGDVFGQSGTGGNLNLVTPLLTGAQKSVVSYTAGGALSVSVPSGSAASVATSTVAGGEIDLNGNTVAIDSAIVLPSGKLVVNAANDVTLGAHSRVDLSGQPSMIQTATVYGFGGTVILNSNAGGVSQAAGGLIDVSATKAAAGSITIGAGNGTVALSGALRGAATDGQTSGDFSVTAANLPDFAGLNAALTQGGIFDARSFDLRQGDLTIGDGVKARNVTVSVDNGTLSVNGTIDASGNAPGTIRLAAMNGLTLAPTAVLDAHGTVLQTDSYGVAIEARNRGEVELAATRGMLTLSPGSTIDVSTPDGVARGQIELNASRTSETGGDINLSAAGPLTIKGAQSIAVNGFWRYAPTDTYGTIVQDNGDAGGAPVSASTGYVGMKQIDARSQAFMAAALANGNLMARVAGLAAYTRAFHLRPGVEIDSATPNGNLTIAGDIDLSGFRYTSVNPGFQKTGVYGSGEPGALVIRAGGNLDIVGSVSDGFMPAPATPDDNGWVLKTGVQSGAVETLLPVVLNGGTSFPNTAGVSLRYDIPINGATINANALIPTQVTLSSAYTIPAGTRLTGAIYDASGTLLYSAGTTIANATTLNPGTRLGANSVMPGTVNIAAMTWPSGASLGVFASAVTLSAAATVPFEGIIPAGTNVQMASATAPIRPTGSNGKQGAIVALAAMLPEGDLSWSIRGVAGADLAAADTRVVKPLSQLKASGISGNLTLSDTHYGSTASPSFYGYYGGRKYGPYLGAPQPWCNSPGYSCAPGPAILSIGVAAPSAVRTGTGNLDMIAGGSFSEQSLYGVYTAGTPSAPILASDGSNPYNSPRGVQSDGTLLGQLGADKATVVQSSYQAWYPEHGGNVLVAAQGSVTGNIVMADGSTRLVDTDRLGTWLWRQGGGSATLAPTSWWINFGTYVNTNGTDATLTGFQGIGTLGGGNLTVIAGGNAGVMGQTPVSTVSTGLNLAVGSTGRVLADGTLVQTGGGDLTVKVGGAFDASVYQQGTDYTSDYFGVIANLRGNTTISAGSIGGFKANLGASYFSSVDPRTLDATTLKHSIIAPGFTVTPGDGSVTISTRGDLVLGGVADAGTSQSIDKNGLAYTFYNADGTTTTATGGGGNLFTLFTPSTSIAMYSAGGDASALPGGPSKNITQNAGTYYPGTLSITAANGDIRFIEAQDLSLTPRPIELLPSPFGQLRLLAAGTIYGSGQVISMSGADMSTLATPTHPLFYTQAGSIGQSNASLNAAARTVNIDGNPIVFGEDTSIGNLHAGDNQPAQVYAGVDIDDLVLGAMQSMSANPSTGFIPTTTTWYLAAKPFEVIAGRDIVGTGATPDVFVNNNPTDITFMSAGRDILYQSVKIAGPGLLDVEAGRNLYQGYRGTLESVGPLYNVNLSNAAGGAGITVMAGVGAAGPDYTDFARMYFDPANQLPAGTPLAGSGKVVHTYDQELYGWLNTRFGYTGSSADALTYFLTLPALQQGVFVRQVYYAELTAGGREYNNASSVRYGSYLRGRNAIATLFPGKDASGQPIGYSGNITLFSGVTGTSGGKPVVADAGIRTDFGGDIQTLTPGGQTLVGVEGVTPGAGAGLITQGSGDIDIYAQGSVLLGQSRVMTTFGGNILAWSASGDINAGRGAKTTVLYTPPRRVYDGMGDVTLSPNVPSSGAGIATLNPIPEVPPGDVDLIAPLGTIDAGEAGIRVSGNVNLAALAVVNAANVQVQGKSTGLPTITAVNVGALTNASATAAQAASAAQDAVQRERNAARQSMPSIFTVRTLGAGGEPASGGAGVNGQNGAAPGAGQPVGATSYNPSSRVQIIGHGADIKPESLTLMTDDERRRVGQTR